MSVGRNHTCDVILRDISVSRTHCILSYNQGELWIRDNNSKFGTLVSPLNPFTFYSD